jgi:hypothetical protein
LATSGILKREGQQPQLPHLVNTLYQQTSAPPAKGVRTMGTLLLNARTVYLHPTSTQKISKHFACYLLAITI